MMDDTMKMEKKKEVNKTKSITKNKEQQLVEEIAAKVESLIWRQIKDKRRQKIQR